MGDVGATTTVVEGWVDIDDVDTFLSRLDEIATECDVTIQAFDARYVASREHLERAVALARRAFAREENVADDPAVEILLYAAGRRQIDRALAMGVEPGEGPVAIVVTENVGEDRSSSEVRKGPQSIEGNEGSPGIEADEEPPSVEGGKGPPCIETNAERSGEEAGEGLAAASERVRRLLEPEAVLDSPAEDRLRSYFEIDDVELEATAAPLEALVLERVALLDVEK